MESEQATRQARIDPRLARAGWTVTPFDPSMSGTVPSKLAVEEWPTDVGPADYALCDEHTVRGVVEAKKLTVGAQGILPQAERYSRAIRSDISWQGAFGVPFLYSTNGEETWFHDVRRPQNRSRKVGRVEILLQSADKVLVGIQAASKRVDRSYQAVLTKAFHGDLASSEGAA